MARELAGRHNKRRSTRSISNQRQRIQHARHRDGAKDVLQIAFRLHDALSLAAREPLRNKGSQPIKLS